MPKVRSNYSSPEERAVTIRKFRSSGLTQVAFCKRCDVRRSPAITTTGNDC